MRTAPSVRRALAALVGMALLLSSGLFVRSAFAAATTITSVTNPINAANQGSVTVRGTADPGDPVEVLLQDSRMVLVTVPTVTGMDGRFEAVLNATVLADGAIKVEARTPADPAATTTVVKDTQPPAAPTDLTTDPDAVNVATGPELRVSAKAAGADVSSTQLTVSDGTTTLSKFPARAADGTFGATFDTSSLADGDLTVTATAFDAARNASSTEAEVGKDATPPAQPSVTFDPARINEDSSASTVTVSGSSSEPAAFTVTITGGGVTQVKTDPIDDDTAYSVEFDAADFPDGTITASVVPVDAAGNTGKTGTGTLEKDTDDPEITALEVSPAKINADDASAVTVSGTSQGGAGTVVTVTVDGVQSPLPGQSERQTQTQTVDESGAFSFTFDLSGFSDGTVTVTAQAKDPAGNVGPQRTTAAEKDTKGPGTTLELGDRATATLTAKGTTEPGATVRVTITDSNNKTVEKSFVSSTASFAEVIDVSTLADGTLTGTATATDSFGNTGSPSASDKVTKDTTELALVSSRPTGTAAPSSAEDVSATYNEPLDVTKSTINVFRETPDGEVPVPGNTSYRDGNRTIVFTPDAAFVTGPYVARTSVTESSFEGETAADVFRFTVDADAPPAPTLTSYTDPVNAGNRTQTQAVGTAPADADVTVTVTDRLGAVQTGTGTADGAGDYAISVDVSTLADGVLTAFASTSDGVGNRSDSQSRTSTKDTTVPEVSELAATPVNRTSGGSSTVTGRSEPGSLVTVSASDGTSTPVTATARVATDGTFSAQVSLSTLEDGDITVTATSTDNAGNTGQRASTTTTKDTVAPTLTGVSATVANKQTPSTTVTGLTEPFAVVTVTASDRSGTLPPPLVDPTRNEPVTGSDEADAEGRFALTLDLSTLEDGPIDLALSVVDARGNAGEPASETTSKDTVAPGISGLTATDTTAATPTTTISGSTEPGSTVVFTVTDGANTVTDSATAGTDGKFSRQVSTEALSDGAFTVTAQPTDPAGNEGAPSSTQAEKDATGPAVTELTSTNASAATPTVTIGGATGESGVAVSVTVSDQDGKSMSGSTTAGEDGRFTVEVPVGELADGPLRVVAQATDAKGNAGSPASVTAVKDTVAPTQTAATPSPGSSGPAPATVEITFSEPLAATSTVTVTMPGCQPGRACSTEDSQVSGTTARSDDRRTLIFTPDSPLVADRYYRASAGAYDSVGNRGDGETTFFVENAEASTSPSPSASATVSVSPSPTETAGGGGTPSASPTPTETAGESPSPSPTPTEAAGESPSPSPTPTEAAGESPSAAPTNGTGGGGGTGGGTGGGGGGSTSPTPSASTSPAPSASASAASPSASPSSSSSPSASPSSAATRDGAGFVALSSPTRVLDSRDGTGTPRGLKRNRVVLDLSDRVPSGATAAVLNLTVTNPSANGFVVVFPDGNAQPGTSNVNFLRNQTQANEVVVGLPASRRVVVFVDSASAHVIADLVGFFTEADRADLGRIVTQAPTRVLDSRDGTGTSQGRKRGEVVLDLSGLVPAGTTAVALNVTVAGPSARGFVVVYPSGTSRPGTSNVNFEPGQTQANEVVTRLGTGANAGKVSLYVDSATAAVIADLVATVVPRDGSGSQLFTALEQPRRVMDSRDGTGTSAGRKSGTVTLTLPTSAVPAGATGVVLNVTTTGASRTGFVSVFPTGTANPGTSNVNFRPGVNQANEVLTAINTGRQVTLFVGGSGTPATHVIVDVVGYLTSTG